MVEKVRVGNRWIGDGESCFIIAEAGSNHNGSFEQAKQLIDVAVSAGADAVKFQVFRANSLYPKSAGFSDYLKVARPIYDIIAELEMPYEWIPDLASYCRDKDVLFLASVFDEVSADQVERHVEAFKIASYEMTHIPLIRHVAKKSKPVIISTGTANLNEVAETVDEFRRTGNNALILMQCTAAYPAPLDSLNVRAIASMKEAFGVPVGLSDHSRDPLVGPLSAVAVGANLIEKHVTLSNELPGPDHRFALEPDQLRLMIQKIREAERVLGNGRKEMHPVEMELRWFARRSVFAVRDIRAGEPFTEENIAVLRSGTLKASLEPKDFWDVLGKRARRNIPAESAIEKEDYV
ncbi:MAG TPA: N-acetylneuraminate synthase family protein [Anaerolineales bacterium]|nr:N-acetylneuraminate synthase family protein [Anaerolineales bacterium]